MSIFDEIERDASKPRTTKDWAVVTDDPYPGWVKVSGPALKCSAPTSAMDLNEQDYTDRHRDARRIARVPDLERIALAAKELEKVAEAVSIDANGTDYMYETAFHGYVFEELHAALATFREATK